MPKAKRQLERIDIDELFENSSNRGMLSFLEAKPDEARERLEQKQKLNELDSGRLLPVGDLPTGGDSPTASRVETTLPFPAFKEQKAKKQLEGVDTRGSHPLGMLPLDVSYPVGDLPPDVTQPLGEFEQPARNQTVSRPEGTSPTDSESSTLKPKKGPPLASITRPEGKLPTGVSNDQMLDGKLVGRRQKIRRAVVAQDGHSSGEQLLYQSLWNAGRIETPESRLLCVGYNGMSALCKLDRSNCKKNIVSLIDKLSIQVVETYESATSTGNTYRIFSYKEILRRREAAGLIWVIRTSGVRFVDPEGNLPIPPVGDSPIGPGGTSPTDPVRETPTPPVGETPTALRKNRKWEGITTSAIASALSSYGLADDNAVQRLVSACTEVAPDCTEDEIIHFIQEKGSLTKARASRIQNPIGFLIDAVPKAFAGESFRRYRQSNTRAPLASAEPNQAERDREWGREHEAQLEDPSVPEHIKAFIRRCLGIND